MTQRVIAACDIQTALGFMPVQYQAQAPIVIADGTISLSGGLGTGTGTVTQVDTGTGLAGGPITSAGTISLAPMAAGCLLGNPDIGSAVPRAISLGTGLSLGLDGKLSVSFTLAPAGVATLGGVLANPGTSGEFVTGIDPATGQLLRAVPPSSRSGQPMQIVRAFDGGAVMQAGTYVLSPSLPMALLAGALRVDPGTGTVTATLRNNGTAVAGGAITATGTVATATISARPTMPLGSSLDVVLSGVSGSPSGSLAFMGDYA